MSCPVALRTDYQKVCRNETHISAVEAAPRAHPRFPGAHEHRRGPQGSVGAARQGPRPPVGLTAQANAARVRSARYRLRGAGAFEQVFKFGVRYDARLLQLIAAPAAQEPGRVGYVIGRKALPRAVDRNRLRRQVREHVRAARPAVDRFDIILRVRERVNRKDIAAAAAEARILLARLTGDAR
jgi:ribonuclease P protein component